MTESRSVWVESHDGMREGRWREGGVRHRLLDWYQWCGAVRVCQGVGTSVVWVCACDIPCIL